MRKLRYKFFNCAYELCEFINTEAVLVQQIIHTDGSYTLFYWEEEE